MHRSPGAGVAVYVYMWYESRTARPRLKTDSDTDSALRQTQTQTQADRQKDGKKQRHINQTYVVIVYASSLALPQLSWLNTLAPGKKYATSHRNSVGNIATYW